MFQIHAPGTALSKDTPESTKGAVLEELWPRPVCQQNGGLGGKRGPRRAPEQADKFAEWVFWADLFFWSGEPGHPKPELGYPKQRLGVSHAWPWDPQW